MYFFLFVLLTQLILFLASLLYLLTGLELAWHCDALMVWLLGITIYKHERSHPLHVDTKIILANHRSFTDFFLDSYLIGKSSHLSRWMVAVGLPCVGLYGWLSGRGLFFHRGNTKRQQLAELIERHISFKKAPLIYYPEGHRNVLPSPLTIKHGGIKMCFEKKWTLQLSITAGKERALAEKNFTLQFFTPCYWILSSPLNPNNYSSFEEFYEAVDQEWQRMWELSYHSSRHSFERYKHPGVSFCFNFNRRWLIGWGVLFLFHLGYYNFVYS